MQFLLVAALFVGTSAILFPPKKIIVINIGNGTGKPFASFGVGPFTWEMGLRPWPPTHHPQSESSSEQAASDINVTVPITVIQPPGSTTNATLLPMMSQMPIMTVYYPPTTMVVPAGQDGQVLVPVSGQQGQFVDQQTGGQTIFVPTGQQFTQQEVEQPAQTNPGG